MIAYVILHWMTIDETVLAVESALATSVEGETVGVVVVDNASPNGSGLWLNQRYKDDPLVHVLMSDENLGFARGNNLGVKYAVEHLNPEYIVVMNNDVVIKQTDFTTRIREEYKRKPFDVLGPDIWVPSLNVHQSPKRLDTYSYEEVKSLLSTYERRIKRKSLIYVRNALKRLPLLRSAVLKSRKHRSGIDWTSDYEGAVLHGACVIFSRKYLEKRGYAFNPGTFMYFEMEILDFECERDGFREIYRPTLKVEHHHNVSTKATYRSDYQRVRFMDACIIDSLRVFLDIMLPADEETTENETRSA